VRYIDNPEKNNLQKFKTEESKYDRNGQLVESDNMALAKCVTVLDGSRIISRRFFVSTHNGSLYDPLGASSNREKFLQLKTKEVNQKTFDYYMQYLESKNSIFLTRSQRGFING